MEYYDRHHRDEDHSQNHDSSHEQTSPHHDDPFNPFENRLGEDRFNPFQRNHSGGSAPDQSFIGRGLLNVKDIKDKVGGEHDPEETEAHQKANEVTQDKDDKGHPPEPQPNPEKQPPEPSSPTAENNGKGESGHSSSPSTPAPKSKGIFPKIDPFKKARAAMGLSQPVAGKPKAELAQPNVSPHLEPIAGLQTTGGTSLPKELRQELDPKLGFATDRVRIHNNEQAHQANETLNSRGFAYGNHLYFGRGQYDPHSPGGKKLIAHELTHVNQRSTKIRRWGLGDLNPVNLAKKAVDGAKNLGKAAVNTATRAVNTAKSAATAAYNGAKSVAKSAATVAKSAMNTAKSAAKTVYNGAKTAVKTTVNTVKSVTKTVAKAAVNTAKNVVNTAKHAAKAAYNGAKTVAKTAVNTAKHAAQTVKSAAKNAYNGAKEAAKSAVKTAKEVGNWVAKHKDVLSEVGHTALDIAGFIPVVGTAADLINAGWYAAEGRYGEAAASAMSAIPGVGDAFAAGKMGVKLAANAPKAMKAFKAAAHFAPMAPSIVTAGNSALHGDFTGAAVTLGSAALPMVGGRAGQKLLNHSVESGSKVQALAGKVLSRGSGAAPNAIGAMQTYQTYQAYQRGEVSQAEVWKSAVYTGMPFVAGRSKRPAGMPEGKATTPHEPHLQPISDHHAGSIVGAGPNRAPKTVPSETPGRPSPIQHPAEPHDPFKPIAAGQTTGKKPPALSGQGRSGQGHEATQREQLQNQSQHQTTGAGGLETRGYQPQPGERSMTKEEYKIQSSARRNFAGKQSEMNCALQSSQQVIRASTGRNLSEAEMIASGKASAGYNSKTGTAANKVPNVLQAEGVKAKNMPNKPTHIQEALKEGKGVISAHHAGKLWGNKAQGGHAVHVTGVVKDANGKVTHYIINDTGTGQVGRHVTAEQYEGSLLKAPATVTEKPISHGGSTARKARRERAKAEKAQQQAAGGSTTGKSEPSSTKDKGDHHIDKDEGEVSLGGKRKRGNQGSETGNQSSLKDDRSFHDPKVEDAYQAYVKRKGKGEVRDRHDWKERSDFFKNGPMARGNKFNETVRERRDYDYNEIHLENGKRLDSYRPPEAGRRGEIVSRKAIDFDNIKNDSDFTQHLREMEGKYQSGTKIRSNKYSDLDDTTLEGQQILEVPRTNSSSAKKEHFEKLAAEKGIEIRYTDEH